MVVLALGCGENISSHGGIFRFDKTAQSADYSSFVQSMSRRQLRQFRKVLTCRSTGKRKGVGVSCLCCRTVIHGMPHSIAPYPYVDQLLMFGPKFEMVYQSNRKYIMTEKNGSCKDGVDV